MQSDKVSSIYLNLLCNNLLLRSHCILHVTRVKLCRLVKSEVTIVFCDTALRHWVYVAHCQLFVESLILEEDGTM